MKISNIFTEYFVVNRHHFENEAIRGYFSAVLTDQVHYRHLWLSVAGYPESTFGQYSMHTPSTPQLTLYQRLILLSSQLITSSSESNELANYQIGLLIQCQLSVSKDVDQVSIEY